MRKRSVKHLDDAICRVREEISKSLSLNGEITRLICESLEIEVDFSAPPDLWGESEKAICDLGADIVSALDSIFERNLPHK